MNECVCTFGQAIVDHRGGVCAVSGCTTYAGAIEKCVRLAIATGMAPPLWYQFWRPQWPEDCRREHARQIALARAERGWP